MPINIACPLCPHGIMRGDRIQGAFECDMCSARMPPSHITEDARTVAVCPCRKCSPKELSA